MYEKSHNKKETQPFPVKKVLESETGRKNKIRQNKLEKSGLLKLFWCGLLEKGM